MHAIQEAYLAGFVKAAEDIGISAHDMANIMSKTSSTMGDILKQMPARASSRAGTRPISEVLGGLPGETVDAWKKLLGIGMEKKPYINDLWGNAKLVSHKTPFRNRGITGNDIALIAGSGGLGVAGLGGAGYGAYEGLREPTISERLSDLF